MDEVMGAAVLTEADLQQLLFLSDIAVNLQKENNL